MKLQEIRRALTALVLETSEGAKVLKTDIPAPVQRPAFKIDVLPVTGGDASDGTREKSADIDIFYYPRDRDAPRDENADMAERLLEVLSGGFSAGGAWICLDDDMSVSEEDGVLVCQMMISWSESMAEDGETMDTLIWNREELVFNGDYTAEN